MSNWIHELVMITVLAPLVAGCLVGLSCRCLGKRIAHAITIMGMFIAFVCAALLANEVLLQTPGLKESWTLYPWVSLGNLHFDIGFLVDGLSAIMLVVVTFVSLLVHIYSVGYMQDDPGYARFFSYMSLFTFAMLCLVLGNNFLVMFFGWEGVGLVSYLLIGFWFHKESAAEGSFKAFLVNRVGDLGFLMGIALILKFCGSLTYADVFARAPSLAATVMPTLFGYQAHLVTIICLLLFIGAMGKSAQVPLHVWLPESMEGPTPISALIHAATMVTAGVYMVARLSPLFELSETALTVIMLVGSIGALLMGLVGIVQNDIKRVIAYSTMSQLGYMMAANGVSAYAIAIFHLTTHAFFKALLFLGAGSVIMGLHHEQDLRNMGNLRRAMPVTYTLFLVGTLALVALPPFAGYFSKDAIIEAVALSHLPGAGLAHGCLVLGAFVTAFYSFRALFLAFHGRERMSSEQKRHLHESSWVVLLPLTLLAIPSVMAGWLLLDPMIISEHGFLSHGEILTATDHPVVAQVGHHMGNAWAQVLEAPYSPAFWATIFGTMCAWLCYIGMPSLPNRLTRSCQWCYQLLVNKFGFDIVYDRVFVRGSQYLSDRLYQVLDRTFIDGFFVNGSARLVSWLSGCCRQMQTGYVYHYVMSMLFGVVALVAWVWLRVYHLG